MRCKWISLLVALAWLPAGLAASSRADEFADKGREIFKRYQHAVVTVEIVLKTTYSAGGQTSPSTEARQDITGTVVDPSGLTVVALSTCDPGELFRRMMTDRSRYKVDTEIGDLKMLLADGTELPAEIVLRDKDLDLAFIRPQNKPAGPMTAVNLSHSGTAQVLDQVIAINRLNQAASRAYSASVESITAVVQKPRTFYVPDSTMTATSLGCPAFLPNGDFLGLFVMRTAGSSESERPAFTPIIVPAEDILRAAKQAPAGKGDAARKEESEAAPAQPGNAPNE
jgi:Trypsin-like peptidase domain